VFGLLQRNYLTDDSSFLLSLQKVVLFFLFAGIMIGIGILLGLFLTIGSKVPTKEDQ